MRRCFALALVLLAQLPCAGSAGAAEGGTSPIKLVVPFPPGGGGDYVGRAFSQRLAEILGRTILIDNRGGGGTTIATEFVAKSPPDGNTLLLVGTAHVVNPSLYKELPYDTEKDFAAISPVTGGTPLVLLVHPGVGASTVQELIALAKARPGQLNYSSPGNGSPTQLAAELFKYMAGIDITHVPYKGSAQSITDLLGGRVQLTFGSQSATPQYVKEGRLKALAVTTKAKSKVLPDVPPLADAGVPDYDYFSWQGVVAPGKTPRATVRSLSEAIISAVTTSEVRERLLKGGYEVWTTSPDDFSAHIAREIKRWKALSSKIGAQLD